MHSNAMSVEKRLVKLAASKNTLILFTTKLVTLATLTDVPSRILSKTICQRIPKQYMKEMVIVAGSVARTF
jgi:hypothetical protein